MPFKKIQLRPGIVRDVTNFSNEGGWYDCDNVRFRMGMPESIGGWIELLDGGDSVSLPSVGYGVCRCLHQWTTLAGQQFTAIGTDKKLLLLNQTTVSNITPVEPPIALAANPFTMNQNPGGPPFFSSSLRVQHVGHGRVTGDSVIFSGASSFGGFSAADINKEFQITVVNANSYDITMSSTVSYTAGSGGGSSVVATYEIPIGSSSNAFVSGGWGVGTWGQGTWGTPRSGLESGIRVWSIDNFGEDLVAAIIGGKIYYWDASAGVGSRAVELSSIAGSNQCPTINSAGIAVSEGDRHLLVFGSNEFGSATADPLLIRWGNQESLVEWEPRRDTTAGGLRVSAGSRIIAQTRGRQETVIWTDIGINALTFVGPPYTFGLNTTAQSVSIVGPNAVIEARNQLYWMDLNAFRFYNGSVNSLPCTVQSYVFDDFNWFQRAKVCAGHNSRFNEVWWWYPSADSIENNRYVAYNYVDNYWIIGSMSRTAWLDSSFSGYPIAWGTEMDRYRLFQH